MQEGDLVKIDLLVEHSGSRKSKDAWHRVKNDYKELAQLSYNIRLPVFYETDKRKFLCEKLENVRGIIQMDTFNKDFVIGEINEVIKKLRVNA